MTHHSRTLPRRLAALGLFLAALLLAGTGARAGDSGRISLFDEGAASHAAEVLRQQIGHGVRVLRVEIEPEALSLEVQDPTQPHHIDLWRFRHVYYLWDNIHRETVSGPEPVPLDLVNPDLEANLFDLSEIDFTATARLARAAVERVALEDPAGVESMRIERRLFLIPAPSSGAVRWTVSVRSARETALAYADAKGRIERLNLDGTVRAKTLDMHAGGEPLAATLRDIREIFGGSGGIERFRFAQSYVWFLARNPADPARRTWYTANLNGVLASRDETAAAASGAAALLTFGLDQVDWSLLPGLPGTARQRLAMPQAELRNIELTRPARDFGEPFVQWEIELGGDDADRRGTVIFDTTGNIRRVVPPKAQRTAPHLLEPAAIAEAVAVLNRDLGPHGRIMELDFRDDTLMVTAQDPKQPGALAVFLYKNGELERSTLPPLQWRGYGEDWYFDLAELDAALVAALPRLESETLTRLAVPGGRLERLGISKYRFWDRDNRATHIEIRVAGDGDKAGRITYDTSGRTVSVVTP